MAIFLCFGTENDIVLSISTTPSADGKDKDNLFAMMTDSFVSRTLLLPLLALFLAFIPIWGADAQDQALAQNHLNVTDDYWGTKSKQYTKPPHKVLLFGDSIMSGYGLVEPKHSIQEKLNRQFVRHHFVDRKVIIKNMSHPGETTSGAVNRIKYAINAKPDVIVLAIGGNDALRGVDPDVVYNNLNIILKDLARSGIYTLFVGMQSPPSLGYDYMSKFNSVYGKLSEQYPMVFMPFLLEGVAGNRQLNQRDGIHPNQEGTQIIAENMSPYIARMLTSIKKYKSKLDNARRHREFRIKSNESRIRRGLAPKWTQDQIDGLDLQ